MLFRSGEGAAHGLAFGGGSGLGGVVRALDDGDASLRGPGHVKSALGAGGQSGHLAEAVVGLVVRTGDGGNVCGIAVEDQVALDLGAAQVM